MGCLVEGCCRKVKIRGYCQTHYTKARRHGLIDRLTPRPEHLSLTARFARSYTVDPTGCWLWTGTVDANGYGVIVDEQHRNTKAHRFSYEQRFGFLPAHLGVCHECDVSGCVNPDHLFLGTDAENRQDSVAKARHSFGDRNGRRKLSSTDVLAIRSALADGSKSQRQLASEYGVAQ